MAGKGLKPPAPGNVSNSGEASQRGQSGAQKRLGDSGERLAALWLTQHGYHIISRNWRSAVGELDIVSERGEDLIFVEVKTRRGTRMGAPEEAVTRTKRRRLIRTAQYFLLVHGQEQRPYRIDVIAVEVAPSGKLLDIRHYPGCIELEG